MRPEPVGATRPQHVVIAEEANEPVRGARPPARRDRVEGPTRVAPLSEVSPPAQPPPEISRLSDTVALLSRVRMVPERPGRVMLQGPESPVELSLTQLFELQQRAGTALLHAVDDIQQQLDGVVSIWMHQQDVDEAQPVTAYVSKVLADAEPIELELRRAATDASAWLGSARRLTAANDLVGAAKALERAERATLAAQRALTTLRGDIQDGAQTAIEGLTHTRTAAAVTVGVLAAIASGGAATGVMTSGTASLGRVGLANGLATAAPALAATGEAASRVALDVPVDGARLTKDAAVDVLLSRFGGRISNRLFDKLAGHPAVRSFGRAAFARVATSIAAHLSTTAVATALDGVFDQARGRPVTWAQIADRVADRLSDPKGIFIAALFGAVTAATTDRTLRLSDVDAVGGADAAWPAFSEVNPRRRLGREGRTQNCAHCAVALDASLAGRPATALPGRPLRPEEVAAGLGRTQADWIPAAGGERGIARVLRYLGPGSRAVVFGFRGEKKLGHFFNVVNRGGEVTFLDGQTHSTQIGWAYFESVYFIVTEQGGKTP